MRRAMGIDGDRDQTSVYRASTHVRRNLSFVFLTGQRFESMKSNGNTNNLGWTDNSLMEATNPIEDGWRHGQLAIENPLSTLLLNFDALQLILVIGASSLRPTSIVLSSVPDITDLYPPLMNDVDQFFLCWAFRHLRPSLSTLNLSD